MGWTDMTRPSCRPGHASVSWRTWRRPRRVQRARPSLPENAGKPRRRFSLPVQRGRPPEPVCQGPQSVSSRRVARTRARTTPLMKTQTTNLCVARVPSRRVSPAHTPSRIPPAHVAPNIRASAIATNANAYFPDMLTFGGMSGRSTNRHWK